jgi:hypothetical protein
VFNRRKVSHNKSAKPVLLATLETLITFKRLGGEVGFRFSTAEGFWEGFGA